MPHTQSIQQKPADMPAKKDSQQRQDFFSSLGNAIDRILGIDCYIDNLGDTWVVRPFEKYDPFNYEEYAAIFKKD